MDLIKSLTESKLFVSKTSFQRYTGKQLAELAYLHIIALRIMACENITIDPSKKYARQTSNHDNFKKWHQSGTDLYYLMYALEGSACLRDESADHYVKTLHIDLPKINAWLLSVGAHDMMRDTRTHRLFSTLDNQFKVTDPSLRAIRRLAMNWTDLGLHEKKLCFTRLVQIMRTRCASSDLLHWIEKLSRLELVDHDGETDTNDTTLIQAARAINEDGDAVATTSGDIAPFVKPLGALIRRNPK